jgi:hypothetical protein
VQDQSDGDKKKADGKTKANAAARLADQREDVLLKALRDFKSGARVASGMASMTDVVYGLNDDGGTVHILPSLGDLVVAELTAEHHRCTSCHGEGFVGFGAGL